MGWQSPEHRQRLIVPATSRRNHRSRTSFHIITSVRLAGTSAKDQKTVLSTGQRLILAKLVHRGEGLFSKRTSGAQPPVIMKRDAGKKVNNFKMILAFD